MHPEADAFLDAIFAEPDDDTPRLVYADWLEEHGQANYAQFMRLQCAAACHKFWTPEANDLWQQIGSVWKKLADEWWDATRDFWRNLQPRAQLGRYSLDAVHFTRGFPKGSIAIEPAKLLRYPECWPWLPSPRCYLNPTIEGTLATQLARLPALRRIRHLDFEPGFAYDLGIFLRSPHLSNVRTIDLSSVPMSGPTLRALLTAPNLVGVQEVYVRSHDIHAEVDSETIAAKLRDRFPLVVRV